MPVLEEIERQALREADATLAQLQRSLEDAASSGALDREVFERFRATAMDLAARVNESLPPEIDAIAADEIRKRLIAILTMNVDELPSLDVADRFLIEMEALRHIFRDLLQEQPAVELRDAGRVVKLLEEWLPGVGVAQLAELLGYSPRQLQRRRKEGGMATHRAQLVARLVAILRDAWTDEGVAAWFYRRRRDLDGARPVDWLDDAGREPDLLMAARAGRVQGGI
jgi:hypothetical protein